MDADLMFEVVEPSASGACPGVLSTLADGSHVVRRTDLTELDRLSREFLSEVLETTDVTGTLADGRPVSMPGAHPDGTDGFTVPALVVGAGKVTRDTELEGVRCRVPGLCMTRFNGSAEVFGVPLCVTVKEERVEVTGRISGVGWHEYLTRTKGSVELLVELWSGVWVGALEVQVRYDGRWHDVLRAVDTVDRSGNALIPAGELTGEVLTRWIEDAARLGVVPWVARPSRDPLPLEMGPMVVGAALEGYASIMGPQRRSSLPTCVQRQAVQAVEDVLTQAGVDPTTVLDIADGVRNSLRQQGKTFVDKVTPLVEAVAPLVPELNPDVPTWVKRMRDYRNAFAHMDPASNKPDLRITEDNITALQETGEVGQRVLQIVMVRDLLATQYGDEGAMTRLSAALTSQSPVRGAIMQPSEPEGWAAHDDQ